MKQQGIRSFIALYPDATALRHITAYIDCLAANTQNIRWEKPDQVHITLKFLENQSAATLDSICSALRFHCIGSGNAGGELDTPGGFPNLRDPSILWLGFSFQTYRINELQHIVDRVCADAGIEKEKRRFTPHFTIGRIKQRGTGRDLENVLAACSFQPVPVECTSIRIMESTLTPQGAIHSERASIVLTPGE